MKTAVVQACDKCDCTSPVAAAFVQCFADGEVPAAAVSKKIMEAKIAIEDHIGDEGLKASAQANRDFTNSGLRGGSLQLLLQVLRQGLQRERGLLRHHC